MKRSFVKSLKEYNQESTFDDQKILEAAKRLKNKRKMPTSIALEEATILDLKKIAEKKGIPYQILMRMLIIEGLKKLKDAA